MNIRTSYIGIGVAGLLLVFGFAWFFFFRPATPANPAPASGFGSVVNNNSTSVSGNQSAGGSGTNGIQSISQTQPVAQQKIVEVAQGPVVAATIVQTLRPTTTLARYISAQDGHVYDLPLDVPGAVPRVVSNTTIPGGYRALWAQGGSAVLMQYLEGGVTKTVYVGFPASSTAPTRVQFLPDNIIDFAVSPDGKSVAYLLSTPGGSSGYTAAANGTGAQKLFSLPLSQLLISWPSPGTLLVASKSASGVPGIALAVDVKSGIVSPLVYGPDLTAFADGNFSHVIYQTQPPGAAAPLTYIHTVRGGAERVLSLSPYPEQCTTSRSSVSVFYCATPLEYVGSGYLDLWHAGAASVADMLLMFNSASGTSTVLAAPGSSDGGSQADIFQLAASPDDHYLLYVTKGDRSLWGVRLGS